MNKRLKIEDLRLCLSYDTEKQKFLSLIERCQIHKNQIKTIERSYPLNLSPELEEKIHTKLKEIKRSRWKRPEFRFESEWDTIKKIKIK